MVAKKSGRSCILDRRLKRKSVWRLKTVGIIRLFVIAEDIREAVMLPFLDVIQFLRMIGHRSVLGVDQPALIVPVEAERIAIAPRENLRRLLALGGIEAEDRGGEIATGESWAARHVRVRPFAQPADIRSIPRLAVIGSRPAPQVHEAIWPLGNPAGAVIEPADAIGIIETGPQRRPRRNPLLPDRSHAINGNVIYTIVA